MKGERRHQLQHNELSDALGAGLERVGPYIKWGAAAVLLALAGLLLMGYFRGQRERQSARAAGELLFASALDDAESFRVVSTDYPDSPGGLWATLSQGDVNLAEALQLFYSDREQAKSFLTAAEEAYRGVISRGRQPLIVSRAHLGLAKTLETQSKLTEAAEQYRLAADQAESDELRRYCTERADALGQSRMTDFYGWLGQLGTISAAPPTLPETNLGSLPDQPDAQLPTLPSTPPVESATPPSPQGTPPSPEGTSAPNDGATTQSEVATPRGSDSTQEATTKPAETSSGEPAAAPAEEPPVSPGGEATPEVPPVGDE